MRGRDICLVLVHPPDSAPAETPRKGNKDTTITHYPSLSEFLPASDITNIFGRSQIYDCLFHHRNNPNATAVAIMVKKASGENTKKASGNAKKAEAAAAKAAEENQKKAVVEDEDWGKGAKNNAKK